MPPDDPLPQGGAGFPDCRRSCRPAHKNKINTAQLTDIGIHIRLFKPIELDPLFIAIEKCIEEMEA